VSAETAFHREPRAAGRDALEEQLSLRDGRFRDVLERVVRDRFQRAVEPHPHLTLDVRPFRGLAESRRRAADEIVLAPNDRARYAGIDDHQHVSRELQELAAYVQPGAASHGPDVRAHVVHDRNDETTVSRRAERAVGRRVRDPDRALDRAVPDSPGHRTAYGLAVVRHHRVRAFPSGRVHEQPFALRDTFVHDDAHRRRAVRQRNRRPKRHDRHVRYRRAGRGRTPAACCCCQLFENNQHYYQRTVLVKP